MRIGHVAFTYRPLIGGAEVYIDELLRALESDGHSSRVYQADPGAEERAADPRLVVVPRRRRFALWRYNLALLRHLSGLAREDRLVVHDTIHFPPVAWHRGTVALSHGVTWDHPSQPSSNRRRLALARFAWRRARTVVANDSEFLRAMGLDVKPGERFFEEVAPRRYFIPNVADPTRFCPGPGLEALAGAPVVLVPRNIVFGRGIHLAVDAFATLARERPRALLLIAGGIFDLRYRDRVQARIRAHGLEGRVLFSGLVPQESLLLLYRSAALTLIPTICLEGTSLAALESMCTGTPVVATTVGGLKDLPCVLAAPEPQALGRALLETLEGCEEAGRIQREAVRTRFRPELWRAAWARAVAA